MAWTRALLLAGLLGSALGCQNNTIHLEDETGGMLDSSGSGAPGTGDDGQDDGRPTTTSVTVGTSDTTTPGVLEDGFWLMAIDTPLGNGLPFQFLVEIAQQAPGSYNIGIQSLALDLGSTTSPRTPVGEVHGYYGLPLGGGAPLQLYTGEILIPGAANPITGSDTTVDIFIDGMEIGDPFCGAVSGAVLTPIQTDLTGSTFATTRLAATDPASLPVDFPLSCN